MSDDIVKRLREYSGNDGHYAIMRDAADEIERLRKEKERADILIRYAIEYEPNGLSWLNDWFHGDPPAMQELRSYRGKP
jgi:hypothetical protein